MKLPNKFFILVMVSFGLISLAQADDVALVTALEGKIILNNINKTESQIESFIKLKIGDVLNIFKNARLQITYFKNGRQESWTGAGKLEINQEQSVSTELPEPQIKQIPLIIVKQLARTPTLDSQGRAGAMRLRGGFPDLKKIETINNEYKKLRANAAYNDLNPELYLLSGMFEMNQFDKVEEVISQLKNKYPNNKQANIVITLYTRAVNNARMAENK